MDELDRLYEEMYNTKQAIEEFSDDERYCEEMNEWLDYLQSEIERLEELKKREI